LAAVWCKEETVGCAEPKGTYEWTFTLAWYIRRYRGQCQCSWIQPGLLWKEWLVYFVCKL